MEGDWGGGSFKDSPTHVRAYPTSLSGVQLFKGRKSIARIFFCRSQKKKWGNENRMLVVYELFTTI